MSPTRRLAVVLLVAGALCAGHGVYLPAKALVGQALLARAWHAAQADNRARVRPWPWADTWPVARLVAPAQQASFVVLAGAQGESLAWGPGHVSGTALPGERGNAAIGGHRDTSFGFLKDVRVGDALEVERPDGARVRYRVTDLAVVDHADTRALAHTAGKALTLVTCFPFDSPLPGPTQRYVVRAIEDVKEGGGPLLAAAADGAHES